MIYVLSVLLPPLGLLLNGQPFSAIFNLFLIVFCVIFGLFFHVLLRGPCWRIASTTSRCLRSSRFI